jgi:S1-C subfamily serine protease
MHRFFLLVVATLAGALHAADLPQPVPAPSAQEMYRSVVRIEVATQTPNYATPWNAGRFSGGIGTGFLIGPNQFLTNAHVVSNGQRFLITIYGSPEKHPAKVEYIAHDCDLALLSVEDFSPFEKLPIFSIGQAVPALESQVRVIGYPIGGERLSVTRGVVSRIDFQPYSHSRADSHLVVQIDAAINPGNSGGPVLQNDSVIGVAFQGLTEADNTGYIIPTPVIQRFLKDIRDGRYDHYVDLGIAEFPLINPAMRAALSLPNKNIGVLVTNVTPTGSCDGVVKEGDVLIAIDDHPIDAGLIREGKEREVTATLKTLPPAKMYAIRYEEKPRYVVCAGLLFQPLDTNLFATASFRDVNVRRLYSDYVSKGLFQEFEDVVILTDILADELNSTLPSLKGKIVKTINGTKVTSLAQAHDLLYPEKSPEYLVIELLGVERPLVLPYAEIPAANERVSKNYQIKRLSNLKAQ